MLCSHTICACQVNCGYLFLQKPVYSAFETLPLLCSSVGTVCRVQFSNFAWQLSFSSFFMPLILLIYFPYLLCRHLKFCKYSWKYRGMKSFETLQVLINTRLYARKKQIIRYRATATLRRVQIKQYTASNERGGLQNQRERPKILIKYVVVHPTAVFENYFSSGMLTILIKVHRISILSNIFAGRFTHIISLRTK